MEGEPKVSVQIRTEYKGYPVTIIKEDSGDKLKPLVDSTILTIDYLKEKGFVPIDGKSGDVYVAKPEVEKQPVYHVDTLRRLCKNTDYVIPFPPLSGGVSPLSFKVGDGG